MDHLHSGTPYLPQFGQLIYHVLLHFLQAQKGGKVEPITHAPRANFKNSAACQGRPRTSKPIQTLRGAVRVPSTSNNANTFFTVMFLGFLFSARKQLSGCNRVNWMILR